jgi:hypothetical protein
VYWKANKIAHMVCGTLTLAITFTMGLLMIKKDNWYIRLSWHTIMGVIVLGVTALIVIGGYFAIIMLNKLKWSTGLLMKLKMVHKVHSF